MKKVAVIGAGPSGITAIKNFNDHGFEVTAFERCEGVGGNWRFNDPSGHSSVFETTHIISSKYTSFYEDFPLPKNASDYPSHKELLKYFNDYANHFDINKFIKFGTEVLHCKYEDNHKWKIQWKSLNSEITNEDEFDALVVCNGHHHEPRYPDYPGDFSGEYLHSHDYKSAKAFADKRVLVIGGGNSACDVAVETARVSKKTTISWRRVYHLIPKFMFGLTTDIFSYKSRWLPSRLRIPFMKFMLELIQGKNEDIGLPKVTNSILATHPTVNSELYDAIRHGKVNIADSYAVEKNGEIVLINSHIASYKEASYSNHKPMDDRKLLLKKREISKLIGKMQRDGFTIVPTKMYFKKGKAKLEHAIA